MTRPMLADELINDPVLTVIAIFFAVIVLASIVAAVSLARDWWARRWAARAAENAAAIDHTDDCERCAPTRARLQELDPLHGMTEGDFLDLVRARPTVDVGDAGAWEVRR